MSNNQQITTRAQDYAQWYLDIIRAADLAEHGDARGTMIIKPNGYAVWERMQRILDDKIKESGTQNAYFPLFIPKSFLSKEASHIEGFAKECAVVTHYRLKNDPETGGVVVDPDAKLEEELIVRPTSETVIHSAFARWISSYRDLPLKINQWANVVRWEMRTRLFLRTSEFLWQEGHTAHATNEDAQKTVDEMLEMYRWFAEEIMAMPVVPGEKSESERFAGADKTFTIEGMMQDGKALQTATSHNLGQSFSHAFGVQFSDQDNTQQYAWLTSWGITTRSIGALIMSHSDDLGLVLPPQLAPTQVVIIPIIKEGDSSVHDAVAQLKAELSATGIRVLVDDREHVRMGEKMFEWEKKGVPVRMEVGPRDIENGEVMVARRDMPGKEHKQSMKMQGMAEQMQQLLNDIQKALFDRAAKRMKERSFEVSSYEEFKEKIEEGGFFYMPWCGSAHCEEQIKEETKATIRCLPFDQSGVTGTCVKCGMEAKHTALFARAY